MIRRRGRPMSLESSSHLPGGFQIKHRTLGIYQGSAIELAFWYPSSGMPEYGLCRFATMEKAESYRTYLCSPACPEPLDGHDLTIEPYDLAAHQELINNHPLPSAWETPI
jgi:hypothetical protein